MCGISGFISGRELATARKRRYVEAMNHLQKHRGPDGEGIWLHPYRTIGLGHVRLSIIDLNTGQQPMSGQSGDVICYNGEIYNYLELREELKDFYEFRTHSDTEVILAAYLKWGADCLTHLRGMFAFVIWDEGKQRFFCARDRFGIKPFYYTIQDGVFYFASEAKALMPFLPEIKTNPDALTDYLTFQFTLEEKTLFQDVHELIPGHFLYTDGTDVSITRYWEVYYHHDWDHDESYFINQVDLLLRDSVKYHLRSDVPVGAYVSGGVDSGIVSALGSGFTGQPFKAFTGKFTYDEGYDESLYARDLAAQYGMELYEVDITAQDFVNSISKVIYHLDLPVAGPGSFPQYHVSKLAAQHRKVVLGGQGGDEIFGGYTRYLIAYFEQCIKGAIDGTLNNGNYVVTYESIIPNLRSLKNYKPLLRTFWQEGLFGDMHDRYFRLINRAPDINDEINWRDLGDYHPHESFSKLFNGHNVRRESYFDLMTHFDFKTLLPALLQVEDRMSMAHGLESRVPFLDHPLIEMVATIPADKKFKNGKLKRMLMKTFNEILPRSIVERKDKMGFPVPLNDWLKDDLRDFVFDTFGVQRHRSRPYFNTDAILNGLNSEGKFGRKVWGLLSLELWHQNFHDKQQEYKDLIKGV